MLYTSFLQLLLLLKHLYVVYKIIFLLSLYCNMLVRAFHLCSSECCEAKACFMNGLYFLSYMYYSHGEVLNLVESFQ